jgi:hypothetical protein
MNIEINGCGLGKEMMHTCMLEDGAGTTASWSRGGRFHCGLGHDAGRQYDGLGWDDSINGVRSMVS